MLCWMERIDGEVGRGVGEEGCLNEVLDNEEEEETEEEEGGGEEVGAL